MTGFFQRMGRNAGCAECGEDVCCGCQCPPADLNNIAFGWVTNVDDEHPSPISWSGTAFKLEDDEFYPDTYVQINGFGPAVFTFYLDCGPEFSGFSLAVGISNDEAGIAHTWLANSESIVSCETTATSGLVTFLAVEESGGPSVLITVSW
ncbi:MAG: hypothetical protein ACAI35_21500 [Candidatus Methylacidiphilales bacterium]